MISAKTIGTCFCLGGRKWNEDWAQACQTEISQELKARFNKAFRPKSTPIPRGDSFPANIAKLQAKKWKNAGSNSHKIAAAAMAFLLHDRSNGFANVEVSWTGGATSTILIFCYTI